MDVFTDLIMVIISQHVCVTNHDTVHLKFHTTLDVNRMPIKLGEKKYPSHSIVVQIQ